MNYLKVYVKLIKRAQSSPEPEIGEKHHVFPKSIYGKNNFTVKLTPKEHYIAHALLYKGFKKRYGVNNWKTKKMMHAFWFMHALGPRHNSRYTSSRLYQSIRVEFIESIKQREGKQNPFFGKKHSVLTRRKISLSIGGTGQVEGCYEFFEEKFNKVLGKSFIRPSRVGTVPDLDLSSILKGLSMVG